MTFTALPSIIDAVRLCVTRTHEVTNHEQRQKIADEIITDYRLHQTVLGIDSGQLLTLAERQRVVDNSVD